MYFIVTDIFLPGYLTFTHWHLYCQASALWGLQDLIWSGVLTGEKLAGMSSD